MVPAAIEAMADQSSRRSLERCGAGVSRELPVGAESATRTKNARQGTSGEQVDAAETCQRLEPHLSQLLDSRCQFEGLFKGELEPHGQSPHRYGPLGLQRALVRRRIGTKGGQSSFGLWDRKTQRVFGIDLKHQRMGSGFADGLRRLLPDPAR
jgi:hypothetical protein